MTDYSKLSDFEINRRVAESMGLKIHKRQARFETLRDAGIIAQCCLTGRWVEFDYCNNPADAWPVIHENLISVSPCYSADNSIHAYESTGKWCAEHFDFHGEQITHTNPLRAAMIVFLMMKEANND